MILSLMLRSQSNILYITVARELGVSTKLSDATRCASHKTLLVRTTLRGDVWQVLLLMPRKRRCGVTHRITPGRPSLDVLSDIFHAAWAEKSWVMSIPSDHRMSTRLCRG